MKCRNCKSRKWSLPSLRISGLLMQQCLICYRSQEQSRFGRFRDKGGARALAALGILALVAPIVGVIINATK